LTLLNCLIIKQYLIDCKFHFICYYKLIYFFKLSRASLPLLLPQLLENAFGLFVQFCRSHSLLLLIIKYFDRYFSLLRIFLVLLLQTLIDPISVTFAIYH